MPTYIALLNYTQKGMETAKDGAARRDAARKMFAAAGANLKAVYMTMGRCDAVAIAEAPDDATMARLVCRMSTRVHSHRDNARLHRGGGRQDRCLAPVSWSSFIFHHPEGFVFDGRGTQRGPYDRDNKRGHPAPAVMNLPLRPNRRVSKIRISGS